MLLLWRADFDPRRIVLLDLANRVIGVLLRPTDRLERRTGDRVSPDGSRRRRAGSHPTPPAARSETDAASR